jgi:ABC-2 type transport system ATP-binding protein
MDDIEALATRLLVIGNGRIVADGTIEMLHRDLGLERRVVAHIDPSAGGGGDEPGGEGNRSGPSAGETLLQNRIREVGGTYSRTNGQVDVTVDPSLLPVPDVLAMITSAFTVRDVFIDSPPIEEIVSRIYARDGVEM